jgi:uncharacterized membrane protein
MEKLTEDRPGLTLRISPLQRMFISVLIAGVTWAFIRKINEPVLFVVIATWCTFALSYLVSAWTIIVSRKIPQIKKVAKREDGSRLFVVVFTVITSFAAIVTVLLLVIFSAKSPQNQMVTVPISFFSILISWALVHTILTFHYAHLYYDDDKNDSGKINREGLLFPGDHEPDYRDFAYFSFVVGMTFQVSDVQITDKKMRRLVLAHGLMSFVLNTFVVALTVNFIAGLKA